MIVAILIKSKINASKSELGTLNALGLKKQNSAVLLREDKHIIGMLNKVKNYVTWGEIDKETLKSLLKNRAMISNKKKYEWKEGEIEEFVDRIIDNQAWLKDKNIKNLFRLSPPKKGFKGNKKKQFSEGGELGYRKEKINELILRMI
ncbi:MAG: 50S ribosomal protein L30 [Candidatus Rehaiarchaeum fermentans]|nr:50S ribosomal protein L30 [Candidatus Rehaiarchaeum fermentans]